MVFVKYLLRITYIIPTLYLILFDGWLKKLFSVMMQLSKRIKNYVLKINIWYDNF